MDLLLPLPLCCSDWTALVTDSTCSMNLLNQVYQTAMEDTGRRAKSQASGPCKVWNSCAVKFTCVCPDLPPFHNLHPFAHVYRAEVTTPQTTSKMATLFTLNESIKRRIIDVAVHARPWLEPVLAARSTATKSSIGAWKDSCTPILRTLTARLQPPKNSTITRSSCAILFAQTGAIMSRAKNPTTLS